MLTGTRSEQLAAVPRHARTIAGAKCTRNRMGRGMLLHQAGSASQSMQNLARGWGEEQQLATWQAEEDTQGCRQCRNHNDFD